MEKFDYLESQDFTDEIDFALFIIEYFKNDYLVIRDFLFKDSPWDILIEWVITIAYPQLIKKDTFDDNGKKYLSHDELVKRKVHLVSVIYATYYNCVVSALVENAVDGYVTAPILDQEMYNLIADTQEPVSLMLKNDFFAIKILKYFIHALEIKLDYPFKVSTYNKFKYDVSIINEIWKKESEKQNYNKIIMDYELNEKKEDEIKILKFNKEITELVRTYIRENFREKEDVYDFINYLFSLAYAYLKRIKDSKEELEEIEEDIITLVESSANLTKIFFTNFAVASQILELIYDSCMENAIKYDFRDEIKDERSREMLRDLDIHIDDEFEPGYMLHTYGLDDKLELLIKGLLETYDKNELMLLLLDETSLYDILFYMGLDARNSNFYKKEIIRKIIADVYEFLGFKLTILGDLKDKKCYEEIKNLKTDLASIINYFVNNYLYLFEQYSEYQLYSEYFHEKALFNSKKNGDLKKIDKISLYSINRYIQIFSGNMVEFESVDYLNDLLSGIYDTGKIIVTENYERNDKLFRLICLNVYERIINLDIKDEFVRKFYDEIIKTIEETENFSNFYIAKPQQFKNILSLFLHLNDEDITNKDEMMYRKRITDEEQVKVLKKLNKYEEN